MAVGSVSYSPSVLLNSFNNESDKDENIVCYYKKIKQVINQNIIQSSDSENIISSKSSPKRLNLSNSNNEVINQLSPQHDVAQEASGSEHSINTSPTPVVSKKDSGIRATPKQVFPNIACLPLEDNIISCFLLSVWDNIVGPQTVYVWKRKTKLKKLKSFNLDAKKLRNQNDASLPPQEKDLSYHNQKKLFRSHSIAGNDRRPPSCGLISDENEKNSKSSKLCLSSVIQYVTEHTVSVADSSKWKPNKLVSYFLSVPQQNIIVCSVRFIILEEGVGVPYCLSAVIPKQDESLLLPALDILKETMHRIAIKIRLFISKEGLSGGDKIRSDLQELCAIISSLNKANLAQYPLGILARIPDDRCFAEKMLTSHLQTMGTSLVIADSPNEANRVVMWLGQFLSAEENAISRISLSDSFWPFQPGVSVQAVIRDPNGSIDLSSSKLLASRRPLTLIDLNSNSVRQMAPMNVHSKNSSASFRMQLMALWHDLDHVPAPSHSLFESVENAASLVKRFLHEYDTLASCETSVKKTFRDAFIRSLYYMTLAVITWTKNEWPKEKKRKGSKSVFQCLCSAFNLEEADTRILFAFAESLQPGYLSTLWGKLAKE